MFHFKFPFSQQYAFRQWLRNLINCDLPERWITQINPRNRKTTTTFIKADLVQHLKKNFISFTVCILRVSFRSLLPRPWQNQDHVMIVRHNFPSVSWKLMLYSTMNKTVLDRRFTTNNLNTATRIILSLS